MKNINIKIIGFGFVLLFLVFGCTKEFQEMNVNPNEPVSVPTSYLLTDAQVGMMSFVWDEWWNGRFGMLYSQYWSQASYTDESRFKPRENVNNSYWIYFYAGRDINPPDGEINGGGMMNLQNIIQLNTDEATKAVASVYGSNENQIAVAMILKAWMFQILSDTWGYIPYTQALNIAEYTLPAYDGQEAVYDYLLSELTLAVEKIEQDGGAGVQGDMIYGGDMDKWKKFANSLKLRIAVRMSKKNPSKAGIVVTEAVNSGVFESNDDNAWLIFETGKPRNNPLNENQKTRSDFCTSKTLIDFMTARNDPRINLYANLPSTSEEHVGMPYGLTPADATPLSTNDVSMPSNLVYAPQAPAFFMNYDEVCFSLAEAANEGFGSGSAQEWYEKGIDASMMMWNEVLAITPTGWYRIDNNSTNTLPDPISADDMAAFKADPMVAWDAGNAAKLIAEQKYTALYMQGLQGWFEWRRTNYPEELIKVGDEVSYTVGSTSSSYTFTALIDPGDRGIPKRMTYPTDEQTLNKASNDAAVSAQNGDDFNTSLYWDPF